MWWASAERRDAVNAASARAMSVRQPPAGLVRWKRAFSFFAARVIGEG
jgi:hypothetical protein